MMTRAINSVPRDGVLAENHEKVGCKTVVNGGTWSKNPANKATDQQLMQWGAYGYNVIYSVCLQRTPLEEVAEIARYKSFGIKITHCRLGNEEDNDVKLLDIPMSQSRAFGHDAADKYVDRSEPFKDAIATAYSSMQFILTAPLPSNQQGERYTSFRLGWCDRIHEEPLGISVDMHVYDRCIEDNPIDLSLTPSFTGRDRYFLEVGALYNNSYPLWLERSKRTMHLVRGIARYGDVVGVQLMENDNGIGLIQFGNLTDWGKFYVGLDWKKIDKIYDRLAGIPTPYKFLIIKFDNGDEMYWSGWYTNAPKVGQYLTP
jgi:hypothetical protein